MQFGWRATVGSELLMVEQRQGRFPQVSGLRFAFDPARPRMHRVVEASVNGQPLDPARLYRVATIDFLAGSVRRSPKWARGANLEWAYRIALEPRDGSGRPGIFSRPSPAFNLTRDAAHLEAGTQLPGL